MQRPSRLGSSIRPAVVLALVQQMTAGKSWQAATPNRHRKRVANAPAPGTADMMPPAPDWVALRAAIGKERGWVCEICGRNRWTELNHCIAHDKRKPEWYHRAASVLANLQAACSECHNPRGHTHKNKLDFVQKQKARGYDLVAFVDSLPLKERGDLYRLVA